MGHGEQAQRESQNHRTRAHGGHCSFPSWDTPCTKVRVFSCSLLISSSPKNPFKSGCRGTTEEERRKHSTFFEEALKESVCPLTDHSFFWFFFSLSDLPLLLLDGGQAATTLRNRSLEHFIRSWRRIAPSASAPELQAEAGEKNNLPL